MLRMCVSALARPGLLLAVILGSALLVSAPAAAQSDGSELGRQFSEEFEPTNEPANEGELTEGDIEGGFDFEPSQSEADFAFEQSQKAVPEPLTLLGSMSAIAIGALLRKEYGRRKPVS